MRRLPLLLMFAAVTATVHAQDNYEIQVYGSETMKKGHTMFELHSNYTIQGSEGFVNGMYPTKNAWHETLEITHGWTENFETGFYLFMSRPQGSGFQLVGTHIRPRWSVPESKHWKVGASLSLEFGYQRNQFSADTWTLEIRPIIDKQFGPWYVAFNPALGKSLAGDNSGSGFDFSPNLKVSYDLTKVITLGIEYYGSVGPINAWDPAPEQGHQIFPSLDLNLGDNWEFNFGVGFRLSQAADGQIFKLIVGHRVSF